LSVAKRLTIDSRIRIGQVFPEALDSPIFPVAETGDFVPTLRCGIPDSAYPMTRSSVRIQGSVAGLHARQPLSDLDFDVQSRWHFGVQKKPPNFPQPIKGSARLSRLNQRQIGIRL
jgi:hypothetical protein